MEPQNTLNSQSNAEKTEWSHRHHTTWFQIIQQSNNNKNSMILAEKQIHRPMGQNWEPRKKNVYGEIIFDKVAKTHNGEKKPSSINGAGKIGKLHAKERN